MSRPPLHPDVVVFKKERVRQLEEARKILSIMWAEGAFDDLDPPVGIAFKNDMLNRVASRAIDILAGQYPEVRIKARPRSRGWKDPRPRARLEISLRSINRKGVHRDTRTRE